MNKIRILAISGLILAIFLPRLYALGTTLTIDEPLWVARGEKFIKSLATFNPKGTIVALQPGVTTAWLSGLATPFNDLAAYQASVAITASILLLIVIYFLIQIFGWKWGMVMGYLLALDPYFIGHSRVLHTDALLALGMLISLLSLIHSRGQKKRYVIFSGIAAAFATLTKLFAFGIIPPIVGIIIALSWRQEARVRRIIELTAMWVGVYMLTMYVIWPALWIHSNDVLAYLWSGLQPYADDGRRVGETSTFWWYYIREIFARITLFTTILLPAAIIGLRKEQSKQIKQVLLFLLGSGIFYSLALTIKGDNDVRYILLLLLTLVVWAGYGMRTIANWLEREKWGRKLVSIIIVIPVVWLVFNTIRLHPHYLAHHNLLWPVSETYKLGWGEGLELAAQWIVEKNPEASVVTFYPRVFKHYWDRGGGTGHVDSVVHISEGTDYLVLYRSMFERGEGTPETDFVNNYLLDADAPEATKVFTINRLPYVWIFDLSTIQLR